MPPRAKTLLLAAGACVLMGIAASCGGGSSSSSGSSASSGPVPTVTVTDFVSDFSAMQKLQGLAAQGKGTIGVLLPDTTSSTRYVQYDAPYLIGDAAKEDDERGQER